MWAWAWLVLVGAVKLEGGVDDLDGLSKSVSKGDALSPEHPKSSFGRLSCRAGYEQESSMEREDGTADSSIAITPRDGWIWFDFEVRYAGKGFPGAKNISAVFLTSCN